MRNSELSELRWHYKNAQIAMHNAQFIVWLVWLVWLVASKVNKNKNILSFSVYNKL